jgi:hypothetical protein
MRDSLEVLFSQNREMRLCVPSRGKSAGLDLAALTRRDKFSVSRAPQGLECLPYTIST